MYDLPILFFEINYQKGFFMNKLSLILGMKVVRKSDFQISCLQIFLSLDVNALLTSGTSNMAAIS